MADRFDIAFPYELDRRGRTAGNHEDRHMRDLVEQVLFTAPGERVNRPEFGSGLLRLVFEPNSDVLATTTQFTVQAALQRWLSDRIEIENVDVENEDSSLRITVVYRIRRTGRREVATFEHGV
jgi:Bacteriophage baseplate protein W